MPLKNFYMSTAIPCEHDERTSKFPKPKDDVKSHTIVKYKLEKMQNHEQRKESIEVNIKGISPLHILSPPWHGNHVAVCDKPET